MIIQVDISGQIQQKNLDSSLGFKRSDGSSGSVFLRKQLKQKLTNKYKGQVVNFVEKVHCIMIYYAIKDRLRDVKEIKICRDVNKRNIAYLLPKLFKDYAGFSDIRLSFIGGKNGKSNGHNPALKALRHRKYADKILNLEMVEKLLLEFK
jgi:hypothetical protein